MKQCAIITYKHCIYELPYELPNDLRFHELSRLSVKVKIGNWETEWVKCGEQAWECEEWDGNAGAGNQRWNEGYLDRNTKNKAGDTGNQGIKYSDRNNIE